MNARKSAKREEVNGRNMGENGDKLNKGRFQLEKELKQTNKQKLPWDLSASGEFPREAAFGRLGWTKPGAN